MFVHNGKPTTLHPMKPQPPKKGSKEGVTKEALQAHHKRNTTCWRVDSCATWQNDAKPRTDATRPEAHMWDPRKLTDFVSYFLN